MIDTLKTTNEKPRQNESVVIVSDTVIASQFENLERKWTHTAVALVLVGMITGTLFGILVTHIVLKGKLRDNPNPSSDSSSNTASECTDPIKIVSRGDWMAQSPDVELTKLELPASRVIVAHTATQNCTTQGSCAYRVKAMQTYHMENRGLDDIGYNFLVGGDGAVYVGRGWDNQGAHTKGYNVNSICIAFIGTFTKITPPKRQLCAAQKIINEGVKLKKLKPDYQLFGHRQLVPTESPGRELYEIIQKWDHWTDLN